MFRKYGVRVSLHRELGWASSRDKIIYGELDAAHAIAAMPIAATLGIGSIRCDCITGLILNLHGNAITLSTKLWEAGVRDGRTLSKHIRTSRSGDPLTFGVVYPFSSHRHLLRQWLLSHHIDPDRNVQLVVVPPAQMVVNLVAGHLDGFCVGEPWNSVAIQSGVGWCAATSAELSAGHPEKVLMVRREFAEKREAEHLSLIAALLEACEFCDAVENAGRITDILSRPEYVGVETQALRRGISGQFDFGHGNRSTISDFFIFYRNGANDPCDAKAAWTLQLLKASGLCPDTASLSAQLGRQVFRPDIYDKAVRLRSSTVTDKTCESKNEIKHEHHPALI